MPESTFDDSLLPGRFEGWIHAVASAHVTHDSMLLCTASNRTPKPGHHTPNPILQTPKPYQPLNPQRLAAFIIFCMHGEMVFSLLLFQIDSFTSFAFAPFQMSAFDFPTMLWPSRGCNRKLAMETTIRHNFAHWHI